MLRSGCAWRMMPHDLPPWKTVYHPFRLWRTDGTWERVNTALSEAYREQQGRQAQPSAAILDSQSVKLTEGGRAIGYDAGKKVHGRKRHLLVDTLGLVLQVLVTSTSVQDRDGAKLLFQAFVDRIDGWCRLQIFWADGGYRGELVTWLKQTFGWLLELVSKVEGQVGFQVLPKRWIIERTFAWLTRQRRLSKDYERLPETSEALIYIAMIRLLVRRLAKARVFRCSLERPKTPPLVLIPAFLLALLALWFVLRQIVQPLQFLESQAAELGWGNYEAIEEPVGGIAEIQHLQNELIHLAHKVKAAQAGLHGYIGAITTGQEEERRRLARELHDDTLQALIALNQRLHLIRLSLPDSVSASSLVEIQDLTTQTMENLRRLTRALRPIYLDDLGLVAALEVLAQETQQLSGVAVVFHRTGEPRRLPPQIELALYRMAQEALNNMVRHAQASLGRLEIEFAPTAVSLHIQDKRFSQELRWNHTNLITIRVILTIPSLSL